MDLRGLAFASQVDHLGAATGAAARIARRMCLSASTVTKASARLGLEQQRLAGRRRHLADGDNPTCCSAAACLAASVATSKSWISSS